MEKYFDGKKIRDEILGEIANKIVKMKRKPNLAVFLIGNNPVCRQYVELKKKMAEKTGILFCLYEFDEKTPEDDILTAIDFLNSDAETDGIMIQIPLPKAFDREKLIARISPEKDIDGLRFCLGLESRFRPPVVLAIMEALARSQNLNIHALQSKKIVLLGHGFLVGAPLTRVLQEQGLNPLVITNEKENFQEISPPLSGSRNDKGVMLVHDDIKGADILISATGSPKLIKADMVKEGVALIDAGTAEENGDLVGDIDPKADEKASYYTPVPGGIGPVTIAKLFYNLVGK